MVIVAWRSNPLTITEKQQRRKPCNMGMSVKFNKMDKYLEARITGNWITDDALEVISDIKKEADTHEVKFILLDLQGLSHPDNEMTRYFSGMKIATVFNFSYKIAGYSQMEKINRFAENVAVNRGINFKMFTSETDAIHWLLD